MILQGYLTKKATAQQSLTKEACSIPELRLPSVQLTNMTILPIIMGSRPGMYHSLLNRSLFSILLFITPLIAAGQANGNYSFSSAQFCTLDDAGRVDCVLAQGYERLQPPANLPELTALTTGEAHACGITVEGQPVCWGDNFFGQLNVPDFDGIFTQIDAGANHTCALETSGQAICWGIDTNSQLEPPVGATFSQLDAADVKSCGLLTDGAVICWSDDRRRSPENLAGSFVKFDLRSGEVCGLTDDGRILCSDGSAINLPIRPIAPFITPPKNGPYTDIATSYNAVCGLQSDGTLDCSFSNPVDADNYPLGEQFLSIQSNETDILISTREIVDGSFEYVPSGTTMCGRRLDGTLQCWDQGTIFRGPDRTAVSNAEFVASFELHLDARIYDTNAVEIFWTPLPFNSVGTNEIPEPIVEVFRNGESIAKRRARFSYFDTSAVSDAEYQIRLIDDAGNPGPLSGNLIVDTNEGSVLYNGEPTLTVSSLEELPDVFTSTTSGSLSTGIVIGWEVDSDIENMIDGYEIRVNGASVGFTRSRLFVDNQTPQTGRCVEIIAIGFDESRLGVRAFGSGCN